MKNTARRYTVLRAASSVGELRKRERARLRDAGFRYSFSDGAWARRVTTARVETVKQQLVESGVPVVFG